MAKRMISITILKELPHLKVGSTHKIINGQVNVSGYVRGAWITKEQPTDYIYGIHLLLNLKKDGWVEINEEG